MLKKIYKWLGKPGLAAYHRKVWYKYLIPKRLTLKCNPPIYRWIVFNFCWIDESEHPQPEGSLVYKGKYYDWIINQLHGYDSDIPVDIKNWLIINYNSIVDRDEFSLSFGNAIQEYLNT